MAKNDANGTRKSKVEGIIHVGFEAKYYRVMVE